MISEAFSHVRYNVAFELAFWGVNLILLWFMMFTNPRRSMNYRFNLIGVIVSTISPLVMTAIGVIASFPEMMARPWAPGLLKALELSFMLCYSVLLGVIFLYMCFMSLKLQNYRRQLLGGTVLFFVLIDIIKIYLILSRPLSMLADGTVDLAGFIRLMCVCGIGCNIAILFVSFRYSSELSRIVRIGIRVAAPIGLFILIQQYANGNILFISSSYVSMMLILFILFHATSFNELTGCQTGYSFETRFYDNKNQKKSFYIIYVVVPSIVRFKDQEHEMKYNRVIADLCTRLEQVDKHVYLFNQGVGSFSVIYEAPFNETSLLNLKLGAAIVHEVLNAYREGVSYSLACFECRDDISSMYMVRSMANYLLADNGDKAGVHVRMAADDDFEKFNAEINVERALLDIQEKGDPYDERVLCYLQPIYNVCTGSFRTAEALMRLQIDGEMIQPDLFIPVAEKSETIHSLTRIMLNKVCRGINEICDEYDFDTISVNVSAQEIGKEGFANEILSIINENGIPAHYISLEITESAVMGNEQICENNMRTLQSAGIRFYLDDYGTSYSSLERLMGFPYDVIKFDKTLLYKSMKNSGVADAIENIMIYLKKNGYQLLVEGVENAEHEMFCTKNGMDYMQGFKYSRPVPAEEITGYFSCRAANNSEKAEAV